MVLPTTALPLLRRGDRLTPTAERILEERERLRQPPKRPPTGGGVSAPPSTAPTPSGISDTEKQRQRKEIDNKAQQEIFNLGLQFQRTRFTDRNERNKAQLQLQQNIANVRANAQLDKVSKGLINKFQLATTGGKINVTSANIKEVQEGIRLGALTGKELEKERTRQRGEVLGLAVTPIPRASSFLRGVELKIQQELATTRQVEGIETGGKTLPLLKQQAKGFGLGFASSLLSTAVFLQQLAEDPVGTFKALPEGIQNTIVALGGVGALLEEQPGFVTGFAVGELAQIKAGQKVTTKATELIERGATRLSPKFQRVVQKTLNVPVDDGNINLKIVGSIDDIAEPLSSQTKLSGTKVTAVSSQKDIFGNLRRTKIEINKPIPNEALLSKSTTAKLKLFREGKLPRNQLVDLNQRIFRETKGSANLLETSFFADPRGRIRPSRLGLTGGNQEAKLLDILSSDITFKRGKPQVLFFDDVKVAKFPPALRSIENKLKKGIPLTPIEQAKLQKFQLTITGEFKPIGFVSREPEITLARGEVIRRKSTPVVTIINGRRVPIIRTEIVRDAKLSKLFQKASLGKATPSELALLKKGTGIDVSSILKKAKFVSPTGLGISSTIATSKRIPTKKTGVGVFGSSGVQKKAFSKRISSPLSSQPSKVSPTLKRSLSPRATGISRVGGSGTSARRPIRKVGASPLVQSMTQRRPFGSPIQSPVRSPVSRRVSARALSLIRAREKGGEGQEKRIRLRPGVKRIKRAFEGSKKKGEFNVFVRKKGKDVFFRSFTTKKQARKNLKRNLRVSLRASGFIVDSKGKKVKPKITQGFRRSKVDPFRIVEKRNKRLSSFKERRDIQIAKRKKKPFKAIKNNFKKIK